MTIYELAVVGISLIGLILCIRGSLRVSWLDYLLGVFVSIMGAALYFFLFSLTRTSYLAGLCLVILVVPVLIFKKARRSKSMMVLSVVTLLMATIALSIEAKLVSSGNALLIINPYRAGKTWVFDEPRLGLRSEPFVEGIPEMIDRLVAKTPGAENGLRLIFSQQRFPSAQIRLDLRREQDGGNWYYCQEFDMEGWLCPALFKFFPRAPRHIYAKAEATGSESAANTENPHQE